MFSRLCLLGVGAIPVLTWLPVLCCAMIWILLYRGYRYGFHCSVSPAIILGGRNTVLLLNKRNNIRLFSLFTRRHVISVSTLHGRALCIATHTHTHVRPLPLVFVNIKPQKDYLNMNSACLCVNEWRRRTVMFTTRTEARLRLAVILTSAASLNEDMNTWTTHPKLLWESLHEHLTVSLSKTILISYTHRNVKVFTATRQNKSSV